MAERNGNEVWQERNRQTSQLKTRDSSSTQELAQKKEKKNDDFSYEVKQEIATIATRGSWELKLRLLSWNGKEDVYDIRRWKETEDGERYGKGISMSGEELLALRDLLMEAEVE